MPATDGGGEPVAERETVFRRVFDAPARLLFTAYSTPEHMRQWFGPPGWTLTQCELDFRPGGKLQLAMTGSDGVEGPAFVGEYLEIVPNRTIIYRGAFALPGAELMTVTISFEEDEASGQTTLNIHTLFASVAMKNAHLRDGYARSWVVIFDQLAGHVAATGAGSQP